MNRRLLWMLVAVMCSITASAYQVGDYIYTNSAKFKVIGENLVQNGDFSRSYTGWKTLGGAALSGDFWSVESGQAQDGSNALMSLSAADEQDGATMYQAIPFGAGKTYIITFNMKGSEAGTTTTTVGSPWYVDVYANTDGSASKVAARFQQVASADGVGTDWRKYSYAFTDTVTGGSTGSIVLALGRLATGTLVSNIDVREVTQVYDTRIAERELAYVKKLLAISDFTENKDELDGMTSMLETVLTTHDGSALGISYDDISSWESFIASYQQSVTGFLDANSYDLTSSKYLSYGLFTSMNSFRSGSTTAYGDWRFTNLSKRWTHGTKTSYVSDYIQQNYDLGEGAAYIEKVLPAGKYFFSAEYKGNIMTSGYTPNYDYRLPGCKLFIGKDSINCDTLDTRNYQSSYIIVDVAEGDTLRAGFWHPSPTIGTKKGGNIIVNNPVLRRIGANAQQEIADYVFKNSLATQQSVLKQYIDSANTVKPLPQYPWGKDALQTGIDAHRKVYDWSFTSIARSECETLGKELPDSVMNEFRLMRSDIQTYYAYNLPYTHVTTEVAKAQASYDDPANSGASADTKAVLKSAIDAANALIAGVNANSHDADSLNLETATATLAAAIASFEATAATYNNPATVVIKNQYFDQYPGAWTRVLDSHGPLNLSSSSYFDGGTCLGSWRGYTGCAYNRLYQVVKLTHKGVYEFSCQGRAFNEKTDKGYGTPSGIYFYAKNTEVADSIGYRDMHTRPTYIDTIGYGYAVPERFVVTYNKTTEDSVSIEFGLNAAQGFNNGKCNQYAVGGFNIRYLGAYDAYIADDRANLVAAVKSAQTLLDENTLLSGKAAYKAVKNGIALCNSALALNATQGAAAIKKAPSETAAEYAASAQTRAYMMLTPLLPALQDVITGIKGVEETSEATMKYAKGIFNLSGMKVSDGSLNGLSKGIYIHEGKKFVVK